MSMFTKRHYEAIAGVFKTYNQEVKEEYCSNNLDSSSLQSFRGVVVVKSRIMSLFIELLSQDNERFNELMFVKACQSEDSKQ